MRVLVCDSRLPAQFALRRLAQSTGGLLAHPQEFVFLHCDVSDRRSPTPTLVHIPKWLSTHKLQPKCISPFETTQFTCSIHFMHFREKFVPTKRVFATHFSFDDSGTAHTTHSVPHQNEFQIAHDLCRRVCGSASASRNTTWNNTMPLLSFDWCCGCSRCNTNARRTFIGYSATISIMYRNVFNIFFLNWNSCNGHGVAAAAAQQQMTVYGAIKAIKWRRAIISTKDDATMRHKIKIHCDCIRVHICHRSWTHTAHEQSRASSQSV